MCGICGVAVPARSSKVVDRAVVARMRDVIAHRGPDGVGMYVAEGVGLGHRRLSIVDLAGGAQPMHGANGAMHIVYNGEVFNHPVLQPVLEARGFRYDSRCDTETVLHCHEAYGLDAPTHLRGMFAYAIWDVRTRELTLVRDRFGVKPLYYALLDDGAIAFGSEIKAVLASGWVAPRLNEGALPDLLANHAPSGEETLFAGVRRLPPGHVLRWRDGEVTITRYWDLHFAAAEHTGRDDRALVAEYRDRLREAVRMRLMADVPLGVFLSGGIDSAAITALMSELVTEPIKSFSVAFAERDANELRYARMVSEKFRTDHHEIVVSPAEFFESLPRLVWHEDEPIAHPSSIPLHFVSRLAGEHVKVVLTGEGSDETLAGYNRYRVSEYNLRLGKAWTSAMPAVVRDGVRGAVGALPRGSRLRQKLSRTFLSLPVTLQDLYFENFAVFSRARQQSLLAPDLRARLAGVDPYAAHLRAYAASDAPTVLGKLLYADTKTYLAELLMKQDQMSMAASIESRVPFLDHPLVEWAAALPDRMKLRGLTTKWILREAMRGTLPPEILSRKKMGFPVPVGAWFRGPYRHLVQEFVLSPRALARGLFAPDALREMVSLHERGVEPHASRLWALVNLEVWQRIFLDGEAPEQVHADPTPAAAFVTR